MFSTAFGKSATLHQQKTGVLGSITIVLVLLLLLLLLVLLLLLLLLLNFLLTVNDDILNHESTCTTMKPSSEIFNSENTFMNHESTCTTMKPSSEKCEYILHSMSLCERYIKEMDPSQWLFHVCTS